MVTGVHNTGHGCAKYALSRFVTGRAPRRGYTPRPNRSTLCGARFVTGRARAHMTEHNRDGVTVKVLSHTMGETGTGANKFRCPLLPPPSPVLGGSCRA